MSQQQRAYIQIQGLEAAIFAIREAPNVPIDAIMPTVYELRDIGVDAAKASLEETTGEKSTGETQRSIKGMVEQIRFPEEWEIQIGSDSPFAKYVARTTGPVRQDQRVQIWPRMRDVGFQPTAKWRFIGLRPRIEKHPFLEAASDAVMGQFNKIFGREILKAHLELSAKTKALEGKITGEIF